LISFVECNEISILVLYNVLERGKRDNMEFQTLRKSHKKELIIGVLMISLFIITIIFTTTRAKYQTAESINIAKGTISYKPYDFKIMAIYQQNSSGEYTEISNMPDAKKYKINESKSYCTIDNVNHDNNAILKTENGKHFFSNLTKSDKCYLYFDKVSVTNVEELLASKTIAIRENFQTLTSNTTGTIYGDYDDDGLTYYYAGAVDDNWVKFAGFYWRIIRINGDGTIRLIYNGTTTGQTGEGTQIGTSAFNENYDDNAYVGYMYGTAKSDTYEATHANTNSSTIKTVIDNWYKTNIVDKGFSNKVDTNAGFCGDRDNYTNEAGTISGGGTGTTITYYGAYTRFVPTSVSSNSAPTFKCKSANDLYTVSGASKGNKSLTYPVGLISVDEVNAAGTKFAVVNNSYYLYTNKVYWTISPYTYDNSNYARVFVVGSDGSFIGGNFMNNSNNFGVRPVINLKADTIFSSGDGTSSNPYVVL